MPFNLSNREYPGAKKYWQSELPAFFERSKITFHQLNNRRRLFRVIIAWIFMLSGLAIYLIPIIISGIDSNNFYNYCILGSKILSIITGIGLCLIGTIMLKHWRKQVPTDIHYVLKTSNKQPILLVRNFSLDKVDLLKKSLSIVTWANGIADAMKPNFEAILSKAFKNLGPLIALGRSSEALLPGAVARAQVADEHWKDAIAELLTRVQLVLFIISDSSDGLDWELENIPVLFPKNDIIYFLPSQKFLGDKKRFERARKVFLKLMGQYKNNLPIAQKLRKNITMLIFDEGLPLIQSFRGSDASSILTAWEKIQVQKERSSPAQGKIGASSTYFCEICKKLKHIEEIEIDRETEKAYCDSCGVAFPQYVFDLLKNYN